MKKREKVIFLHKNRWGGKYEIKELARGFARYLLLQKQILLANEKNLSRLEDKLAKQEKENLLLEEKAQELYQKINNFPLQFTLEKNEKGEPLGSVNFKEILQELEKNGFQLEKSQLVEFHPPRKLGENTVKVKLSNKIVANLKIIIA
ncbi:MAG: 50S ribosomal protein L9 [Candidatus Moeniiplasma glomeromycotorum]|nr:50S ribosomal protein L9 [Candidatus Moeniiplasma glomeromycotorum]